MKWNPHIHILIAEIKLGNNNSCLEMIHLIKHHCRNFRKQLLKFEVSISMAFNRNPYNCPKCDTKMNFVLYIN